MFKHRPDHAHEIPRAEGGEFGKAVASLHRLCFLACHSRRLPYDSPVISQSDMKLLHHHYGKARVRVMKVGRAAGRQSLKELDISIMLQGDFDASYTKADNRLVVPTDTMKNTVNVLAMKKLGGETEPFGIVLAGHFLK